MNSHDMGIFIARRGTHNLPLNTYAAPFNLAFIRGFLTLFLIQKSGLFRFNAAVLTAPALHSAPSDVRVRPGSGAGPRRSHGTGPYLNNPPLLPM
jgi:hypothetical protein